jgi:protoheme IX farnesyltransferase
MMRMLFRYSTWRLAQPVSIRHTAGKLSKAGLTAMVVTSMLSGHMLASSSLLQLSPTVSILGAISCGLCSASASALNQWAEVPYDSQMPRTQCRPLPSLKVLPPTALYYGIGWGGIGCFGLYCLGGWQPAGLAALTIVLYSLLYTPLKRITTWNTWVGAAVGAIPPLIGWSLSGASLLCLKAWILPLILYAWQFPHFNALCWRRREEYARAGYWMTAVISPRANKTLALFWALAFLPICLLSIYCGLESSAFIVTSTPVNLYFISKALKFYSECNLQTCRHLFLASLVHLPALMGLMLLHKKPNKDKS